MIMLNLKEEDGLMQPYTYDATLQTDIYYNESIHSPHEYVTAMNVENKRDMVIDNSTHREHRSRKERPTWTIGVCYKCGENAYPAHPYVNYRCAIHLVMDIFICCLRKVVDNIVVEFDAVNWPMEDQAIANSRIANHSIQVWGSKGLYVEIENINYRVDSWRWERSTKDNIWHLIITSPQPIITADGILFGTYQAQFLGRFVCWNKIHGDCLAKSNTVSLDWRQRWWHNTMVCWSEESVGADIGKLKISKYCGFCQPNSQYNGLHWSQLTGLPMTLVEQWRIEFKKYPDFLKMDVCSQLRHLLKVMSGPMKPCSVTVTRETIIDNWKKLSVDNRWSKLQFGFQLQCVMIHPIGILRGIKYRKPTQPIISLGYLESILDMWEKIDNHFWEQPVLLIWAKLSTIRTSKLLTHQVAKNHWLDWMQK